jgi:hypothetical protein
MALGPEMIGPGRFNCSSSFKQSNQTTPVPTRTPIPSPTPDTRLAARVAYYQAILPLAERAADYLDDITATSTAAGNRAITFEQAAARFAANRVGLQQLKQEFNRVKPPAELKHVDDLLGQSIDKLISADDNLVSGTRSMNANLIRRAIQDMDDGTTLINRAKHELALIEHWSLRLGAEVNSSPRSRRMRFSGSALGVADFERQTTLGCAPRSVGHSRRAAGVAALRKGLTQAEVMQRALEDVHLLPEWVHLRSGRAGVGARVETQQASSYSAFGVRGENALE